jgi:hypothetical protein
LNHRRNDPAAELGRQQSLFWELTITTIGTVTTSDSNFTKLPAPQQMRST